MHNSVYAVLEGDLHVIRWRGTGPKFGICFQL